jgi:hypothetical protein
MSGFQTFDKLLEVVASGTTVTTTATSAAVQIEGLNKGYHVFHANLNISALVGTHDASNYYTIQILGSVDNSTFFKIGEEIIETSTGKRTIAFNNEQIAQAVGDGAEYFKITTTKVGTTATGITFGAYFTKG